MVDPVSAFGAYQRRKNLAPSTVSTRRYALRAFAGWLDKDILEANTEDIEKWLSTRRLEPQSMVNIISHLSTFWDFALRSHLTDVDPTEALIRPKVPRTLVRPWDPVEIAYAIEQADARMRCFLLLPMFAGARCVEISRLQVEDIDRRRGKLLLHGKGAKDRTVPLHDLVYEALIAYGLPESGHVFMPTQRRNAGPLDRSTISKYISRHLHGLGYASTAHKGRAAYGTSMYDLSDGDLIMVAELLGHVDLRHCRRYIAWSPTRSTLVSQQLALPDVLGRLAV